MLTSWGLFCVRRKLKACETYKKKCEPWKSASWLFALLFVLS
uniref:Uncharacterized protein n=1 Tax=Rhizophora mucronata TaxID=61149 RepID=A0A2P2R433_RHIMU